MNEKRKSRIGRARALLATIATFAGWGSPHCSQAQDSDEAPKRPIIVLEGVAVVDVARGEILNLRNVLIVNGLIAAIGEAGAIDIPPEAVRVEGRGRYLMPGLVDMHVHLFNNATHRPPNEWAFPLFAANGVTGVREMRTEPAAMAVVNSWRTKATRGELVAPRVLAAGVAVGAGSVETTRRQVRDARAAGADFLKVFSEVGEPQWRAILEEARALHIPVCGHIPAEVSLLAAATAGQRSNEHLTQVYEACSPGEKQLISARKGLDGQEMAKRREAQEREVLESFDQPVCDQSAVALARTDQVQVPTLVLPHFEARGSPANFRDDPRWHYLRSDEQARWQRILKDYPVAGDKLAARRWEVSRQIVKTLHAAGVRHSGRDRCAHAARLSRIRAAQRAGAARGSRTESRGRVARRHHLAGRVPWFERRQRLNRRWQTRRPLVARRQSAFPTSATPSASARSSLMDDCCSEPISTLS